MKKTVSFFLAILITGLLNAQIRVACIGNSITYGAAIEGRDSLSYPAQMQKMLGNVYNVKNFGVSGATMLKKGNKPYCKENAFLSALEFAPNIVVIKLGTNDSKSYNWAFKDEFDDDYIAMINIFKNMKSVEKIFVCYPVPANEMRWDINIEIVKNDLPVIIKSVADATGASIINLYPVLEGRPELFPDMIHPNAAGAKLIAEAVAENVKGSKK